MNEPTNPSDPNQSPDSPPPPPPPPFTPPPAAPAATPAPTPAPTAAPRPPVYTPPAGEPPKKSKMPWVLGGCGCLALMLIAIAIICWVVYRAKQGANEFQANVKAKMEELQKQSATPPRRTSPAPVAPTPPSTQTTVPRAGWNIYVNQKEKLPSALQSKFAAFSFQYPRTFEVQPQSDANFVKIEKYAAAGKGNTAENFAVGYARFDDPNTESEALYNQLLDQLGQQMSGGFHNYSEVKRNYTTVDGIKCRTALFQADFANAPQIKIFGKTIVVHPPGKEYGVTILMLGTSLSRDVKSPDDLGTKGDTADILRSFTFL